MWDRKSLDLKTFTSTAEVYGKEGVILYRADNDRLSGKRKVDRLLANLPDSEPGLVVFDTCYNLIRTIPSLYMTY